MDRSSAPAAAGLDHWTGRCASRSVEDHARRQGM